jgi:hypothetical protein
MTRMTEMTPEQAEVAQGEYDDAALEMLEAWEQFQEAYADFRKVQGNVDPQGSLRFRSYHDATVEGRAGGWGGGGYIADEMAQIREDTGL